MRQIVHRGTLCMAVAFLCAIPLGFVVEVNEWGSMPEHFGVAFFFYAWMFGLIHYFTSAATRAGIVRLVGYICAAHGILALFALCVSALKPSGHTLFMLLLTIGFLGSGIALLVSESVSRRAEERQPEAP